MSQLEIEKPHQNRYATLCAVFLRHLCFLLGQAQCNGLLIWNEVCHNLYEECSAKIMIQVTILPA